MNSCKVDMLLACPIAPLVGFCRRNGACRAFLRRVSCKWTWLASVQTRKQQHVCCSSDGEEGMEQKGGWSVEAQIDKILHDVDSQVLIQDLNAAVERVAKARRELDALEEQQRRLSVNERLDAAHALVEECQRDVLSAEADVKNAEIALVKARAGTSIWDMPEMKWADGEDIIEHVERIESSKAAAVSGVVGVLAGLPFFAASSLDGLELAVSTGIVLLSCAVFGLTFRYAIRRDLSNTQLKAGCIAAFALVRGLAQVDVANLLLMSPDDATYQVLQGGIYLTESIAIFSFAAAGVEYCFRQGLISPFPCKQQ